MTRNRRKTQARPAPANRQEAEALIARYAALMAQVETADDEANQALNRIMGHREDRLIPIEAEMDGLFNAVRAWWSVAGSQATSGKTKSLVLAGCQVGDRTTPPALALPEDRPEGLIISDLLALPDLDGDYLVSRHVLYRPALIKALRMGPLNPDFRILSGQVGLAVSQREEFFIDPVTALEPAA
jgi:Bacteriophage Mu Gam like protein